MKLKTKIYCNLASISLVFVFISSCFGDTLEDFESYELGTLGSEIPFDGFLGTTLEFSTATVEENGVGNTNALCITEFDNTSSFSYITLDNGSTASRFNGALEFSSCFRFRTSADYSGAGNGESTLVAGCLLFTNKNLFVAEAQIRLSGENWQNYELNLISLANFATSGMQPISDLGVEFSKTCLLYTSPSPRDKRQSRMPSSA